ncbi:MAG TPA: MFS transporter, partial [Corynebacterium sp.]|nr:MFS transporter [Corynebacterium sp.]
LREIFSAPFLATTIKIWVAFSLINFAFNFANQWTPRLLTESGLSAQQGIIGGIMLSFGGTIGSLLYGALTTRTDARRLLILFSFGSAVVLVGFIGTTSLPGLMFAFGVAVGMLLNGCVTGLYTITPAAYPSEVRATGVGAAIGVSRIGAVGAPIIIGYLNEAGWTPAALYSFAAGVTILAGLVLLALRVRPEPQVTEIPNEVEADADKQLSGR